MSIEETDGFLTFTPTNGPAFLASNAWGAELELDLGKLVERLENELGTEIQRPTPSGMTYCGCLDCVIRELLFLIVPRVLTAQREGLVELVDPS